MKKFLCFLLAFIIVIGSVGAVDYYEVDTKYGIKTVVVPDGYTSEDVLCEVAKAYYELSGDFDALNIQYKELSEEVKDYITKNEELRFSYETLQNQYQTLVSLQGKESFLNNFGIYLGLDTSISNNFSVGMKGGVFLAKKILIGGGIRVAPLLENPIQILIEIGYMF